MNEPDDREEGSGEEDLATRLQEHMDRRQTGGYGIECPDCGVAHHVVHIKEDGTALVFRLLGEAGTGEAAVDLIRSDTEEDPGEGPTPIH